MTTVPTPDAEGVKALRTEVVMLRQELDELRAQLGAGLTTKRLTIVDDAGHQRVLVGAVGTGLFGIAVDDDQSDGRLTLTLGESPNEGTRAWGGLGIFLDDHLAFSVEASRYDDGTIDGALELLHRSGREEGSGALDSSTHGSVTAGSRVRLAAHQGAVVSEQSTHVCDECNTPAPPSRRTHQAFMCAAPGWIHLHADGLATLGADFCSWACLAEYAKRQAGEQRHPSTSKRRTGKAAPVVPPRSS